MKTLVILGNQLFPKNEIEKIAPDIIYMAESYDLCTYTNHHKQKITLFLTAMRDYRDSLINLGYCVYYHEIEDDSDFELSYEKRLTCFLKDKKIKQVCLFEIEDKFFEKRIKEYIEQNGISLEYLRSPMFINSRADFIKYIKSSKKPFMKVFYERQRKKHNVLIDLNNKPVGGSWSFDKENRKKLPKNTIFPKNVKLKDSPHLNEVAVLVEDLFKEHPGENAKCLFPTSRAGYLSILKNFIEKKLDKFGDYQDAITNENDHVFHSLLSPGLNLGLILPKEVCRIVLSQYEKNPATTPLNSVEGFIRQVMGWREFVRGIYQNFSDVQESSNYFENKRKMKDCWWDATTGIEVVDFAIKKAQRVGYGHHIERLMVLSNIMLLCDIDPHEVHGWFMNMYVDSSDWVMGPNVYGMGQFSDGGIFATKPYISGSNYIKKMGGTLSNESSLIWDGLYWRFISRHKDKLLTSHRMGFMVSSLRKMNEEKKERIFAAAESFIERVTYSEERK